MGREMSQSEIRELGGQKEQAYRELYAPDIRPVLGLPHFLEELEKRRIPHAVATSAPTPNVDFTMERTGLRRYFPIIIDDTMVSKGKPDPEVYLTAAKTLNMPPDRCVVFEDAILGIQAGKNAGMKVVGLATTHSREELEAENTDYVMDDFAGLSMEKLYAVLRM
jgi:HAD superfamily hydrolase (TIGR01509 family)